MPEEREAPLSPDPNTVYSNNVLPRLRKKRAEEAEEIARKKEAEAAVPENPTPAPKAKRGRPKKL